MAKQLLKFEWDTRSLRKLSRDLEVATVELRRAVGVAMLAKIRSKIRNRTGELGRSWGFVIRGSQITFASRTPYSYASVKGNWIVPKRARALSFQVAGERVFARVVRYGPGAYLGNPRGSKSYLDEATNEFGALSEAAFRLALRDMIRP